MNPKFSLYCRFASEISSSRSFALAGSKTKFSFRILAAVELLLGGDAVDDDCRSGIVVVSPLFGAVFDVVADAVTDGCSLYVVVRSIVDRVGDDSILSLVVVSPLFRAVFDVVADAVPDDGSLDVVVLLSRFIVDVVGDDCILSLVVVVSLSPDVVGAEDVDTCLFTLMHS